MEKTRSYKTKIWMIIVVLLMQIILPTLNVVLINSLTTISAAATEEWDISINQDGTVIATLDEEGTLTISGTGKMLSWTDTSPDVAPWDSVKTEIKAVVMDEGITNIGAYAFNGCSNLETIIILSSVTSIGENAFADCTKLTIYCKSNSTAATYATKNTITYVTDDIQPTISNVEGNPTDWTSEDVTITVTASDANIGLADKAYSFDGGKTWQAENKKIYNANASNVVIKVKDKLGNTATYSTAINITKIRRWDVSANTDGSIIAEINEDATILTITGTGAMRNYTDSEYEPWYSFRSTITTASIDSRSNNYRKLCFL